MVTKTDAAHAKKMLRSNKDIILLDVRTPAEYEKDHINGSVLLPHDHIVKMAKYILPDKTAKIIVGCSSGFRSRIACAMLTALGYENVYDAGRILLLK